MEQFADIIGQDIVVSQLQNALRTGGVSHAYILNGARGSGRHMLARRFAAALLCERLRAVRASAGPPLLEPCGRCPSCLQAAADSNPDICTLVPEKAGKSPGTAHGGKSGRGTGPDGGGRSGRGTGPDNGGKPGRETDPDKKTAAASIGVGDIRRMRADIQVKPYRAARKVYIMPDAEKMTVQAQNALLKTLEEPPAYACLLLLADGTGNFLPTILSRCVTLPLRPVPEPAVEACLIDRFGAEPARARLCARFSEGSIGQAALLLENDRFADLRARAVAFLRDIDKKDAAAIAAFAKEVSEEGQVGELVDFALSWNRDLAVCRATRRTQGLIFADEIQYIIEAASRISWPGIQSASEAVDRARRRLASNVNAELTLQMMLLEIRAAHQPEGVPG